MAGLKESTLSPFEVLEQRKQLERLQEAHNKSAVAVHELSNLPSHRAAYKKRLNIFFRADPAKLREESRADEKKKRAETMEERNKFEAMKARVRDDRSTRAAHLEQIIAARRPQSAATKDPLWDDFGTGERVEVFGLSKAADYNGRVGIVQRYDGERFAVELEPGPDGKKKTLRVRPENLRPAASAAPQRRSGSEAARLSRAVGETTSAGAAFSGVIKERTP